MASISAIIITTWIALGFVGWALTIARYGVNREHIFVDWLMLLPCLLMGPLALWEAATHRSRK
jgi:hypothetical protein